MYVACPSCKTLYRIQPEHLNAAGGQVRCGACRATFSASGAAFDNPREALAHARQRDVGRDIDALVDKALTQVPRSQALPAQQQSDGIPGGVQDAARRGAVQQHVERPSVPKGTDERTAQHARTEEFPGVAQASGAGKLVQRRAEEGGVQPQHSAGGELEQPLPETASVPKDTEQEAVPDASTETAAAQDVYEETDWVEAQQRLPGPDETETPSTEPAVAAVAGVADESVAQAVRISPASPESGVFLLEDEYTDGMTRSAWGAIAAALLLTALLVAQYGYAERHLLAETPQLRPLLELACGALGCDLPLQRDIGRVEILERQVRDHPKVDDALLINVTFANQAAFAQAYPVFEVSFSDVSGAPIAVRRFRPDEYLPAGRALSQAMQPGERAQLMLEVVDPGERAVSFQFEFL